MTSIKNAPWVMVHYKDKGKTKNVSWHPPKEDAVYIADLLRNEKPVYYVESAGGKTWLTTDAEDVGEEET